MLRQQGNVLAAFAQGRQANLDHVQAIVKIFAEPSLLHFLGKILVGGGDDADVDLDLLISADAVEAAFLQDAQKIGLQLGRDVADFIEEDCSAVGQFELAFRLGRWRR